MSSGREHASGRHLARRSDLAKEKKTLPALKSVLVVDDTILDAERIKATLSVLFGYELVVRHAKTLSSALDYVLVERPDIILLDDYLKPNDTALQTIPMLRKAGFGGSIIVISGQLDRHRYRDLIEIGAQDAIHKDDLNSVRIQETLNEVMARLAEKGVAGK